MISINFKVIGLRSPDSNLRPSDSPISQNRRWTLYSFGHPDWLLVCVRKCGLIRHHRPREKAEVPPFWMSKPDNVIIITIIARWGHISLHWYIVYNIHVCTWVILWSFVPRLWHGNQKWKHSKYRKTFQTIAESLFIHSIHNIHPFEHTFLKSF